MNAPEHHRPEGPQDLQSEAEAEGTTASEVAPREQAEPAAAAEQSSGTQTGSPASGEDAPTGEDASSSADDPTSEDAPSSADATTGERAQTPAESRPPVPKPSMLAKARPSHAPRPPAPVAPPRRTEGVGGAEAPVDAEQVRIAARFGKVDEDGTVSVREGDDFRVVGQYPGVSEDEALGLYIRRYLDLKAQVGLFDARLGQMSAKDIDSTLATLTEAVAEPAVVGDVQALRDQVADLRSRAQERKSELAAERAAAKEQALQERVRIVERAEEIANQDPARIQWRADGQKLRALLEEWKEAQRTGPRLDRSTEDALWKRFSAARTQFDRVRRHFFAELERTHAEVKAAKERLIAEAEKLSSSRDWGPTSSAYRDLMDRWKRAGRASRKDDDALWARFRAAQDVFFQARAEANAALDAEYRENLEVKLALLTEAEALVPVRDLRRAKAALRDIQDRWEEAGKVPRADIGRVEGRMRKVEQAIRAAEEEQWRTSDPRVRARAEGAAAQLESVIAGLERDLAAAEASGDEATITRAREALQARKAWLTQVQRAADDAR